MLWLNYIGVSVDGVAWEKDHLRALGINPEELRAHIITHVHDDHANIFDLLINGKRPVIIADHLGFECLVEKASLVLDLDRESVKKMVEWQKVIFGKLFHWLGAEFEFWPTAHPIPTVGFRATVGNQSIVFSGDTLWGERLTQLFNADVVDSELYDATMSAPYRASDLTFHDAGGGLIHPELAELAGLPEQARRHIVPTHLASIPPEFSDKFEVIRPGQTWIIQGDRKQSVSDMLVLSNSPIVHWVDEEWRKVLLAQGRVREHVSGATILNFGQTNKDFFIILGGTVKVMDANQEELARLSTGDFFGEISIMYNVPVTATVKAASAVRLFALDGVIFKQMIGCDGVARRLRKIHAVRPILMHFGIMQSLTPSRLNELAQIVELDRIYNAGEFIIKEGAPADKFFGIIRGRARVQVQGRPVATLYENQVFGEVALIKNTARTADVIAETPVEVFSVSKRHFERFVGQVPMLYYYLGVLAESRQPRKR
ncbi:cyclic nucleotide-binding domain-containing protein [Candidatus Falkowbacteria bacterium]|nr:cyclic nucleotide-binding domain-containing protein [Candidatus Falkowbacteria bacterium]